MEYCRNCMAGLPEIGDYCPCCGAPRPPRYASFIRRAAAYLIDSSVVSVASTLFSIPVLMFGGFFDYITDMMHGGMGAGFDLRGYLSAVIAPTMLTSLITMAATFVYYTLMDSSSRQGTLGKMVLGIRVCDVAGRRISYGRAVGRFFARYLTNISNSIFMVGYLLYFCTDRKQTLHDLVAGTVVLDAPRDGTGR